MRKLFWFKKGLSFPFLQIEHSQCTKCCLRKSIIDHEPKVVAINSKIKFQMVSLTSRRPYLCPSEGHKYGVSILSFINSRGMFRQITRKPCTAQTWDLDKLFIYFSSIISEAHSFCRWMVSILFFNCVTVKTTNTCAMMKYKACKIVSRNLVPRMRTRVTF